MNAITRSLIQFDLPENLACPLPTEHRDMERGDVRLLVTTNSGPTYHSTFNQVATFLTKGDVLVVNTSATIPSALPVLLPGAKQGRLHLSTKLNGREWLIEIREITANKTVRWHQGEAGMIFQLPKGASVTLKQKFYKNEQWLDLWIAEFHLSRSIESYLAANATPIQYDKLDQQYPLSFYQTFFSFHPGSAEMPSAGRGFTMHIIEVLLKKGVLLVPITLHTGISSLEENETPYPEYMEIDPVSAAVLNTAKSQGKRIIAVGTTCIRAIETAVSGDGTIQAYHGNTDLYIDEGYTMKFVDGLLTGFHEPRASHLNMLTSLAGVDHIDNAYKEALKAGYFWHQFGDLHLLLP